MLYMVRRHLGLGVVAWRALPWEEREMLREGLLEEFNPKRWKEELARMGVQDDDGTPPDEFVDEREDNSLEALADIMPGVGFTVRQV